MKKTACIRLWRGGNNVVVIVLIYPATLSDGQELAPFPRGMVAKVS